MDVPMVEFFRLVVKNLWNTGGTIDRMAAAAAESLTSAVGVSLESKGTGKRIT
jgi:hypothetical protein